VHLDAGQRAQVEFRVDLTAAVSVGEVALDATTRGGARAGAAGCAGAPRVITGGVTNHWHIALPAATSLRVESLQASPGTVRPGAGFTLHVGVRNESAAVVVLEALWVDSDPEGVRGSTTQLSQRRLGAGELGMFSIAATLDAGAMEGAVYTVTVTALARDDAGNLFRSGSGGVTAAVIAGRR
jgi:hypothetical protein